ncbi:uncharacterized protein EI90DRAFT_3120953 [Cantharellus anzutake]|uniref:uncharacterized protein n=1 Tax=Cantharellus anzutake TaxID=1750568 RepID=UPI001904158C|nr:uncharacterized protein EI90DRAFT_3120953 [Cantharellus anzutake]KAF8335063.1 hypothetical protein EI90DRAFT_3120953 [Cantharellus anzutake]
MEEPMVDAFLDMDMAQEDVLWYETSFVEHKMDDSVQYPPSHPVEVEMVAFGTEIIDYDMMDEAAEAMEAPITSLPDEAMNSDVPISSPEGRTVSHTVAEESHPPVAISSAPNINPDAQGDPNVPLVSLHLSVDPSVNPAQVLTNAAHITPPAEENQDPIEEQASHVGPASEPTVVGVPDSSRPVSPNIELPATPPAVSAEDLSHSHSDDQDDRDSENPSQPGENEEADNEATDANPEATQREDAPSVAGAVPEPYDEHAIPETEPIENIPSVLVKALTSSTLPSFYLFSVSQQLDDSGGGETPPVLHHEYKHLFAEPIEHIFNLLRTMSVELELMPHGELSLTSEALDLTITEDNVYSREISLNDLYSLQLGCEIDGPLIVRLDQIGSRFIMRYNAIVNEMAKVVKEESDHEEQGQGEQEKEDDEDHREVVAIPDEVTAALLAAEEETDEKPESHLSEPTGEDDQASQEAKLLEQANTSKLDPDAVKVEEVERGSPLEQFDGHRDGETGTLPSKYEEEGHNSSSTDDYNPDHTKAVLSESRQGTTHREEGEQEETQEETYAEEVQEYDTQEYEETHDPSSHPPDEADEGADAQTQDVNPAADVPDLAHEDEHPEASPAEVASSHTMVSSRRASPGIHETDREEADPASPQSHSPRTTSPPQEGGLEESEPGEAKSERYPEGWSEQPEEYAEGEEGYDEYPDEDYQDDGAQYEDGAEETHFLALPQAVNEYGEDGQDEYGIVTNDNSVVPSGEVHDVPPVASELDEHEGDTSLESVVISTSNDTIKVPLGRSMSLSSSKRSFDSRVDDEDVDAANSQIPHQVERKRIRVE